MKLGENCRGNFFFLSGMEERTMASSRRIRKTLIGLFVLVTVTIILFTVIKGCGERRREALRDRLSAATARTTGQAEGASADSQSSSPSGGSDGSAQEQGQLAPAQSPPEGSEGEIIPVEESPGFLEIVDQAVTSYRAGPGEQRAFQASVRGNATSVTMSISGPGGGFTVSLLSGPPGDVTNWAVETAGPSMPGTYTYSTTAIGADGRTVQAQGSNFIVE